MIKYIKFFIIFLLAVAVSEANAQTTATTSSPYSRYGLGDLSPGVLPQNMAMGGISTAVNQINGYNSINPLNPASYGKITLTTIDAGLYGNTVGLKQNGQNSARDGNFGINHIAFAIPTSHASALSFGLMPYSQLGYNYKQSVPNFGTGSSVDTNQVNYLYQGEGGLSKAHIGWGVTLFKHLSIGANVAYLFGQLKQNQATEIPSLIGTLNSRIENNNSIGGLSYDYGLQYSVDLAPGKHLTFGYSGSANSKLNTQSTYIVSQYTLDANGVANTAVDSIINQQGVKAKILLPQINRFGVSYQYDGKFLIGADYTMGNWSNLTIGGVNQGLTNSKTINVGGQYTPNVNAIGNYWATIDYRAGFIHNQSYLNVNNVTGSGTSNITSNAVTLGLGLPLRPYYRNTFYKINLSAEIGQRGTLANGLIKENFVNIRIGFTLNDRWFQKLKFD